MRQTQAFRVARFLAERDQVEIQWPRLVEGLFGLAAELALEGLELVEEAFGRFIRSRQQAGNGVDKLRRIGRAIQRSGLPERGVEGRQFRKAPQAVQRAKDLLFRVAQIRAQRNECQLLQLELQMWKVEWRFDRHGETRARSTIGRARPRPRVLKRTGQFTGEEPSPPRAACFQERTLTAKQTTSL